MKCRLSLAAVVALLALLLSSSQAQEQDTQCNTTVKADIMLLVDGSWSVGRQNFKTMRNFIARMVSVFDIGPDRVQIGLAQYSGDPRTEWHLNAHPTKESLLNAVANLQYKGGNTLTGMALNHILQNNFKPYAGLRPDSRKIGVLITDGKSQDEVILTSQNLRDSGIELYAIGVKSADENELRSIASDPDDIYMYNVYDFQFLVDIIDELSVNLCNSVKGSGREGAISAFWTFYHGSLLGLTHFSSLPQVDTSGNAVFGTSQPEANAWYHQANTYSWQDLKQMKQKVHSSHTLEAPTNLVTSEVTESSFRATWTPPNGTVEKYHVTYMMTAGERIEEVRLHFPPHVSLKQENGTDTVTDFPTPRFLDPQQELIQYTQCNTTVKADIMMLVDGSWSIGRKNFKTMRNFIARMVSVFDIGPDKVQIGLAQYSGDPRTEWHLNAHPTKESLLNAVANLPYKGGNTMTGMALNHILQYNFKPNVGLRPDSRKIGILITDGKSQDEVILTSQNLRDSGIELYAIGVKNADEYELRSIASDPDDIYMYNVYDFKFLVDIIDELSVNLCNSVKGSGHTLEAPTNLVTSEVTESSFRATWTPPNGTVEKYHVSYMMTAGERIEELLVNGLVSTVVLENLNPLTEYVINVYAVIGKRSSEPLRGTETTPGGVVIQKEV
ncbi:cell surface hyaluronidase [Sarotherodon galilaeus]